MNLHPMISNGTCQKLGYIIHSHKCMWSMESMDVKIIIICQRTWFQVGRLKFQSLCFSASGLRKPRRLGTKCQANDEAGLTVTKSTLGWATDKVPFTFFWIWKICPQLSPHIAETQDRINQLIWLHDHAELSALDILWSSTMMMKSYMHGFLKHIAETQDRINQLILAARLCRVECSLHFLKRSITPRCWSPEHSLESEDRTSCPKKVDVLLCMFCFPDVEGLICLPTSYSSCSTQTGAANILAAFYGEAWQKLASAASHAQSNRQLLSNLGTLFCSWSGS